MDKPILVPIMPGNGNAPNIVLSAYAKPNGTAWIEREIELAKRDKLIHFVEKGFAAALPKPGAANAIPSSSGPIPADGTTKPKRYILSLRKDSTKS